MSGTWPDFRRIVVGRVFVVELQMGMMGQGGAFVINFMFTLGNTRDDGWGSEAAKLADDL